MNYIKCYDDVLPKNFCEEVIDKFEKDVNNQKKTVNDVISFTELNITKNENWKEIQKVLLTIMQFHFIQYKKDCQIDDWSWPKTIGYEQLRMKRYLPNNEDEFKFHVDCYDLPSSKRFLVYFFYLNDVNEGGETAFQYNRNLPIDRVIKPKTGRLLIFPPTWTYPHVALKPLSGPKYIIGGYLNYV